MTGGNSAGSRPKSSIMSVAHRRFWRSKNSVQDRVRGIGRFDPGEATQDEISREQQSVDPREHVGLMTLEPENLRPGVERFGHVSGASVHVRRAVALADLPGLVDGAIVEVHETGPHRPSLDVDRADRRTLAGQPDPDDGRWIVKPPHEQAEGLDGAFGPVTRILLGQSGPRSRDGVPLADLADGAPR